MPQQRLRRLGHQRPREGVALVGAQVVAGVPAAADERLEVRARIEVAVVRGQVVQDLRSGVHTGRREAHAWLPRGAAWREEVSVSFAGLPRHGNEWP